MENNLEIISVIKNIAITIIESFKEYGPGGIIGGFIGGVLIQLKTKGEKISSRIINILIAGFIGWVLGRLTTHYLDIPIDIAMVFSSLGGFYSKEITEEIKEIISELSERIKTFKFTKNDKSS